MIEERYAVRVNPFDHSLQELGTLQGLAALIAAIHGVVPAATVLIIDDDSPDEVQPDIDDFATSRPHDETEDTEE